EQPAGRSRGALGGKLVHGPALRRRRAPRTEPREVAGERPLRDVEALTGQERAEVLLGRDLPSQDEAADRLAARLGGLLLARAHPPVPRAPAPWWGKSWAVGAG